ncbi:glycine cleavage system aminomethyltransferase GcvT [Cohaesibacter sp. CAU 1516]|uniref:glycine cleavage system aminomethyltransferase GcvT n=1 Tax=Cohaesibacter sp. CAU 1516 TaxID=2576038 RepID=UPI0010FCFBAC|nr:glycine cleavage system aminomethyltransferase GcvT [Cohaesibacter sp. CAU 1516]TLP45657.1 glycine cleavage system aminomethyltransferase GcvT [Cohaesibacter sp. CAU 1516]
MADLSAAKKTPLYDLHVELGGTLVDFAGYALPVRYPAGIMTEHLHCREQASLFDVSHMGQALLVGPDHETTARALEALTPSAFTKLGLGRMRYSVLLNEDGGIIDDFIVTRPEDPALDGTLMLVVNGACKEGDYAHLEAKLPQDVTLTPLPNKALIAIQGPKAVDALARHSTKADALTFMSHTTDVIDGIEVVISRCGYTGEDGFELSCDEADAERLARLLLNEPEVEVAGLGARDSLRLESGLCLYGHDLDTNTDPAEADLGWAIQKRRREEGGFPGEARILKGLSEGPSRIRVGLSILGKAPAREGAEILDMDGNAIGVVTSGGFAPSLQQPIAMGYVTPAFAQAGCKVQLQVRKRLLEAEVAAMPFVPQRYVRKP